MHIRASGAIQTARPLPTYGDFTSDSGAVATSQRAQAVRDNPTPVPDRGYYITRSGAVANR